MHLQADESGTPTAMTPVATFTQEFQQLMNTLHAQTKATLIVANIPDVTAGAVPHPGCDHYCASSDGDRTLSNTGSYRFFCRRLSFSFVLFRFNNTLISGITDEKIP